MCFGHFNLWMKLRNSRALIGLPMTLGWIVLYSWAVFRVSMLASTWWKLTEFSQLMKEVKVTLQRIYELEFKISEPKALALTPGLFPQAHLPFFLTWKLTRPVSQNSLGAPLSSLLPALFFIYWSLLNFNKWFEGSVINESRWPLRFFSSSVLSSIILILHASHICVCVHVCMYIFSHQNLEWYLCYSMHYAEIMWVNVIRICMRRTPTWGCGRRLLLGETPLSLTSGSPPSSECFCI